MQAGASLQHSLISFTLSNVYLCNALTENVICMQASVGIQYAFTSFTLSNFSQSFALNLTNFNQTEVVPAGVPSILPMAHTTLEWTVPFCR